MKPTMRQTIRIIVAVGFYLLWSLQHLYIAISGNTTLYENFFAASYFPFYSWAWEHLGAPLFPWVALGVVVFEYALGLMMLSREPWARWGQLGGMIWNLLLAPFPWGWTNLLLAGLHGWLYAQHFERSALELFRPGLKAR